MATRTFDDDFSWSNKVQRAHAVALYEQHWPDCEVIEVDSLGRDESVARQLDFGDVDKIIDRSNGTSIHLAQRFRKPRPNGEQVDFSFRCRRDGSDHPIEYDRLLTAHRTDGASYPQRYGFGITHHDALESGFQQFWIFKTEPILAAIESGDIVPTDPIPNKDGRTAARYIPIPDLRAVGAIAQEWGMGDDSPHEVEVRPSNGIGDVCDKCGSWSPRGQGGVLSIESLNGDTTFRLCSDCYEEGRGDSS